MIIKLQSVLFPYARQREDKGTTDLTKKAKIKADRTLIFLLFLLVIVWSVIYSN